MKGLREKDDATADLFAIPDVIPLPPNCYFQEGMKLEAIDPLNLGDICVATVMQVSIILFGNYRRKMNGNFYHFFVGLERWILDDSCGFLE